MSLFFFYFSKDWLILDNPASLKQNLLTIILLILTY